MRLFLLLVALSNTFSGLGQEPHLWIHIQMIEATKHLSDSNESTFKVELLPFYNELVVHNGSYSYVQKYFYQDEVIGLRISHLGDTMRIHFKAGLKKYNLNAMTVAIFNLKIQFHKGYFELPSLDMDKNREFFIDPGYKWKPVSYRKRKLEIGFPVNGRS